jgi:hypothetical protein
MKKGSIEWEESEEEGLVIRIKPAPRHMVGPEVHKHAQAARHELLVALKALIDIAAAGMGNSETAPQKGRTKIKVE